MTKSSACPKCKGNVLSLNSLTVGIEMYVCFGCMQLCYWAGAGVLQPLHALKRIAANDWKIGTNRQLTKNQLWEEELERLYSIWIGIKMLDDEVK